MGGNGRVSAGAPKFCILGCAVCVGSQQTTLVIGGQRRRGSTLHPAWAGEEGTVPREQVCVRHADAFRSFDTRAMLSSTAGNLRLGSCLCSYRPPLHAFSIWVRSEAHVSRCDWPVDRSTSYRRVVAEQMHCVLVMESVRSIPRNCSTVQGLATVNLHGPVPRPGGTECL